MDKSGFKAKRITRTYCQAINAPPDKVFPLLCPVREAEWLDGWQYTTLFSESGLAEEGMVFSTPHPGKEDTVWIVTKHNREKREVEFAMFTHSSRTCVLRISVSPQGKSQSYVDISYTYTGITPEGNHFIDSYTEEHFLAGVMFWEKSMNHFLKTGERLKRHSGEQHQKG